MERNACLHIEDDLDYSYEEILWADIKFPKRVLLTDNEIQNQAQGNDYNSCVFYSNSSNSNILNHYEWSDIYISWKDLAIKAERKGYLDRKAWAYLSTWPKLLKEEWYITGYFKVNTLEWYKTAIVNKQPVSLGSNQIDWSKAKKYPFIAEWPTGSWHAFEGVGYDDENEWIICQNSYTDKMYDKWRFYIKYEDWDLLFPSKYVLIDTVDTILTYKEKIMSKINLKDAKKFVERGLTNWERPQEEVKREEVWAMFERLIEYMEKK